VLGAGGEDDRAAGKNGEGRTEAGARAT
jgi:hypothetical protein